MPSFTTLAPAKLNLFLHMTGKRADGYHLLESIVAFTDFGDGLSITPADELTLEIEGEFAHLLLHDVQNNLVLKAARQLQAHHGIKSGAAIVLDKGLPVGSGYGGGSADAAALLLELAELWQVEVPPVLALSLGSDVPMCMDSQPAFVRGVGELLEPIAVPGNVHVLLAHPRQPLLTVDVYRRFSSAFNAPLPTPEGWVSPLSFIEYLTRQENALQAAAIAIMPVVGEIITAIASTPGCALARMSGSGAGCFGLYNSAADAKAAETLLRSNHPQWWCVATQLKETR